jgi:hypothetical protein
VVDYVLWHVGAVSELEGERARERKRAREKKRAMLGEWIYEWMDGCSGGEHGEMEGTKLRIEERWIPCSEGSCLL